MDDKCLILIHHLSQIGEEWITFRKLFEIINSPLAKKHRTNMAYGTIRKHLKHLIETEIIEYKNKDETKRGYKKPFRLSPEHRWKERLELEWCQRIHSLIQEALSYLGKGSIEEQLSQYHLSTDTSLTKPQPPTKGKLLLEYSSKAYIGVKDMAFRSRNVQDKLLIIDWEHIQPKRVNFNLDIRTDQRMPKIKLD